MPRYLICLQWRDLNGQTFGVHYAWGIVDIHALHYKPWWKEFIIIHCHKSRNIVFIQSIKTQPLISLGPLNCPIQIQILLSKHVTRCFFRTHTRSAAGWLHFRHCAHTSNDLSVHLLWYNQFLNDESVWIKLIWKLLPFKGVLLIRTGVLGICSTIFSHLQCHSVLTILITSDFYLKSLRTIQWI